MKAMAKENTASFSLNMSENADNALSAFGKFFYVAPDDLGCFCYLDPGILRLQFCNDFKMQSRRQC